MGEKKSIKLTSDKELRIFMMPLRQRMLHEMAVLGVPVTGKQLADRLCITPSSAHHHIKKLEAIGLIETDHTEIINGINARFVRLTNVDVRIGLDEEDDLYEQRDAVLMRMVNEAYRGFKQSARRVKAQQNREGIATLPIDLLSNVVHFTDEEAQQFYQQIRATFDSHSKPREGTKAWDILMISYQNESDGEKSNRSVVED